MKRIVQLCFVFLLIVAPAFLMVAEVYMWVDEKGAMQITDQAPVKPAKIIGKETYKRESPEEIQRYHEKQKDSQRQADAQLEAQRRYNQEREGSELTI